MPCRPAQAADANGLTPICLRCEYRINPEGLDIRQPRLSWKLESNQRGQKQTAYQILAASSPENLSKDYGDLWDTGKVTSDETIHIEYSGRPLSSRMQIWWKVRVWDKDNMPSAWSEPATWTMGLLETQDWQAQWITAPQTAAYVPPRPPHNGFHSQMTNLPSVAKWVFIDLGQPRRFDAVRLFPARPYDWPDTPGFLFPLRFRIEVSQKADFTDAQTVIDNSAADVPSPGTNAPIYRFEPVNARYVRLMVTRLRQRDANNYGFALAEMQVLNADANLALGQPAKASDSIENGGWALSKLTDGELGTVKSSPAAGALPAVLLRKTIRLENKPRRAKIYATALGVYEFRINGQRIGRQILAPEWTCYRKRIQYQVYDVTELITAGENALAAAVGEGWYAGRLMLVGPFPYGTQPSMLLQLEIERADGTRQIVATDNSWRTTTDGPIRSSGIYDGEMYDARLEMPGWDMPGFNDSNWSPALVKSRDDRRLVWQPNEPIEITDELSPVRLTEPQAGTYIFDLGQNMVGWCRIRAHGKAGQTITIRHGEMLDDNGRLYTANLRGAPQVDRYIPRHDGEFTFEPHFTYHGFRFVELTGLALPPGLDAVVGRVFHSSAPETGTFACSDPYLNQLMRNIIWTQRANLMSTPNDCPQRDERFGWMGDIQAFAQTAMFNMDMAAFFTKFARDIRDDQADDGRFPDFAPHPGNPNKGFSGAPAWADAGIIVPWLAWVNYADRRLLAEHFDAACRWVEYIRQRNPDLIWVHGRNNDYNDWLNGDWIKQAGWPDKGGSVPKDVFATAFFAHSAGLVSKMAEILKRDSEARKYAELSSQIKAAFNRRFVKTDGLIEGDTQGGYALALNFQLLPPEIEALAAQKLLEGIRRYQNHLSTGIQTTHRAMLELSRHGFNETAWQLLTNRSFPSWLYMIENGATTIWERWDGYVKGRGFQDPGMNSFNHWAFGAVGEWMWRHIGGMNPDAAHPGWKHFHVQPIPGGGVTWTQASYDSIRGRIISEWAFTNGVFNLRITIPPNTTATVTIPASTTDGITESGRPLAQAVGIKLLKQENTRAILAVESGHYDFLVKNPQTN